MTYFSQVEKELVLSGRNTRRELAAGEPQLTTLKWDQLGAPVRVRRFSSVINRASSLWDPP
jgi:hypothetical protein